MFDKGVASAVCHFSEQVQRLCNKAMILEKAVAYGDINEISANIRR